MIGKNPLWVAKQHGHSVQTMLDTYAAWTEGAKESDIEAISGRWDRRRELAFSRSIPERRFQPKSLQIRLRRPPRRSTLSRILRLRMHPLTPWHPQGFATS